MIKFIFASVLILSMTSCSNVKPTSPASVTTSNGEVNLNKSGSVLTVSIKDRMIYTCEVHGSVGFDGEYNITDEKVIALVDQTTVYLNPETQT